MTINQVDLGLPYFQTNPYAVSGSVAIPPRSSISSMTTSVAASRLTDISNSPARTSEAKKPIAGHNKMLSTLEQNQGTNVEAYWNTCAVYACLCNYIDWNMTQKHRREFDQN